MGCFLESLTSCLLAEDQEIPLEELASVAQTLLWVLLGGQAEGGQVGGSVIASKVNIHLSSGSPWQDL